MTDCVVHRGPDDEGLFVCGNVGLGHRRLSIIDLAGGHQPMHTASSDCHVVFNGEIYNYLDLNAELAARGHRIRTRSDTETILHAYEEYGDGFAERLNGMFALAIWDGARKRLVLARDRLGKKPLYIYEDDTCIAFGSEIKSLLALTDRRPPVIPAALDRYFSYGYVPEPATIYEGIRQLPAAHTLTFEANGVRERRYWHVPSGIQRADADERALADELRALVTDAVRIRLMSDVPIGVFLSGGIDSSAITGVTAGLMNVPVKTFSIRGGSGVFDELTYARAVARRFHTDHHEYDVGDEPVQQLLPRLLGHFDQPFADSSMIPTYHVARIARQQVTVALSGEGGDELFAGYPWHRKFAFARRVWTRVPRVLRSGAIARLLPDARVPRLHDSSLRRMLQRASLANAYAEDSDARAYEAFAMPFTTVFKEEIFSAELKAVLRSSEGNRSAGVGAAEVFASSSGTLLSRMLATDLQVYLPGDLLTKVDRMSMASSLEVRCPLLDYRIVEWAATVPDDLKLHGPVSKYILRQAVADVLPPEVSERKTKRGFSVPVSSWLREDLREYAREIMLDGTVAQSGLFDVAGIERVLHMHQSGAADYGPQLWALLSYAVWAEGRTAAGVGGTTR